MADIPREPVVKPRLGGLDIARYIAFVGMVIVNFRIVMGADAEDGLLAQLVGAIEGRAAATFVVLAGVGLGLAGLRQQAGTIAATTRRAVFLLVLGLANMLVFEADILHYYAIYFFFGAMLLPLGTRWLVALIVALNLAFVAMILMLDYDAGWNWKDFTYAGFWTPAGFVRNLFFNGWHPVIPWLGFLLFGIILARLRLAESATQWRMIVFGALLFAAAEGLSLVLGPVALRLDPELVDLITTEPVPPMPLFMMAGIGAASVIVGICLSLSDWLERIGVTAIVAPAGRQTLTLYIAHILIGMGILEALGMLGGQSIAGAVLAAVLFCLVATLYALVWSRRFKRGPVEAAMRKIAG